MYSSRLELTGAVGTSLVSSTVLSVDETECTMVRQWYWNSLDAGSQTNGDGAWSRLVEATGAATNLRSVVDGEVRSLQQLLPPQVSHQQRS